MELEINKYSMNQKIAVLQNSSQAFSHSGAEPEEMVLLVSLGLTSRQARVYLALLKTGDAKAKAVAGIAMINRQEVYSLLDSLQQLGLAQQNVTVPITYSATPLDEGIKLLLEQKTSELTIILQQAERLTKKINSPCLSLAADCKPCFGVVFEGYKGRKYLKAIQETQHAIEAVSSWLRFKQLCFLCETELKDALKKDVILHIVTEKPPNSRLPKWVKAALSKYPNFNLKTQPNLPPAAFALFDNTHAAIAFNPCLRFTKGPALWTTNPTLMALCQTYFNLSWAQTTPWLPVP
jgi:sugar-specific transcriptional regulator TrmB